MSSNRLEEIRQRQKRRWGHIGGGDTAGDGEELSDIDYLLLEVERLKGEDVEAEAKVRREQAEKDALIAESWAYSTAVNKPVLIARDIRRKAGILHKKEKNNEAPLQSNG